MFYPPFLDFWNFCLCYFLRFFFKLCLLLSFKSNSSSPLQNPNSISDTVNIVIFTQVKHFQSRTRKHGVLSGSFSMTRALKMFKCSVFCSFRLSALYTNVDGSQANIQKCKIFNILTSKRVTQRYRLTLSLLLFPRSFCPNFNPKETTTRKYL